MNVTLSFNEKVYKKYRENCKDKGFVVSRQLEIFMEKQIK